MDTLEPVAAPVVSEIGHMGWLPDRNDLRDFTLDHPKVRSLLGGVKLAAPEALPSSVDLRQWCSPIEDQEALGSCTANAGVGIVEYYERRAHDKHLDGSRLFVYKATRDLLGFHGDTGAYLRSTMGALCLLGVPPEQYWPYDIAKFDDTPSAFVYALAQSYQAQVFYRLDPVGSAGVDVLAAVKQQVAAGLPPMFGFTVYESVRHAQHGDIPFPTPSESVVGGHAIVAVGYDDAYEMTNPLSGDATTGALLIRNSWGPGWGDQGYGHMPYDYVTSGLAEDFWVLSSSEWMDTGAFGA
jgi:C1A family cysteine protease